MKRKTRSAKRAALPELRIGQGLDLHRFKRGRKFILGGVEIPHSKGLDGHSDADALLHAVVDAILGATGGDDIGALFPNTSKAWKDMDSKRFVSAVWMPLYTKGWRVGVLKPIFPQTYDAASYSFDN